MSPPSKIIKNIRHYVEYLENERTAEIENSRLAPFVESILKF